MSETNQSAIEFPGDSRIHIGLAVSNLEESKRFYQTLLGHAPTKERSGYIKFETRDPSLNLSLFQTEGSVRDQEKVPAHYGIQVRTSAAVVDAIGRFKQAGVSVKVEEQTRCCYSVQDKVWAHDPDGTPWEVFVVTEADAEYKMESASTCCRSVDGTTCPCSDPA